MKATIIRASELDGSLKDRWVSLQAANPSLVSPYFHPDFTLAVASVRSDVEIAVIEDEAGVAAFFPYQRAGKHNAVPVGGILSDYQGIICEPGFRFDLLRLLECCGLTSLTFDHWVAAQNDLQPYSHTESRSPGISFSAGSGRFTEQCHAYKVEQIKVRRTERDFGPVSFTAEVRDVSLLRQLMDWKSAQYRRTGVPDIFVEPWIRDLLGHLLRSPGSSFAGRLSVLHAGDRLLAAHMGMVCGGVWHWWFPAHDPGCSKHSPGIVLLLKHIEHAERTGMTLLDFGKGETTYKSRFSNCAVPLLEGVVEPPSIPRSLRRWRRKVRRAVGRSALGPPLKAARNFLLRKR